MVRPLRPLLVGLLTLLVVLAPGGTASAHDELLSSDPADGASVQEAPQELVLTFSGQIAEVGAQLQITDDDGSDVADGDLEVRGTELVQALTDLGAGDYAVIWRVTSSDGHPISGSFGFAVAATESATEGATGEATAEQTTAATGSTADEATGEAATSPTQDATDAATDGLPAWVWIVVGLAVLGLVALLARTWSRGRS